MDSGEVFAIGYRVEPGNQRKPENEHLAPIDLQGRHRPQLGFVQQTYAIAGKIGLKRVASLPLASARELGRLRFLCRDDRNCSQAKGKDNSQAFFDTGVFHSNASVSQP